jgi:hypothetical protein
MKDGSPFIVVLLDSARSAEPPHSSGSTGARLLSTSLEALRVAIEAPGSKTGSASVQPLGSSRLEMRSNRAKRSGLASRQFWKPFSHSAWAVRPRSTTSRACSSTSAGTSKLLAGSCPMIVLVAATSSAPRAEPWALPVFCLLGAGQAMMVRRRMNDGLPVSARAASRAWCSASTSST